MGDPFEKGSVNDIVIFTLFLFGLVTGGGQTAFFSFDS